MSTALSLVQGWVGAAVLLATLLLGATAWWWRERQAPSDAEVLVAASDRLRRLPSWGAVVRAEMRSHRLGALGVALALLATALLGSRLVGISDDDDEMAQRDVVLCMDVSGSMAPLVHDVLDTYAGLSSELTEERIGFVMFDANAVTGFALTDDHAEVGRRLAETRTELASNTPVAGTAAPNAGSSLVGDGLASCVQHFDRPEEDRARTLVLATDNLVSGASIYTLQQATDLAVTGEVMVFGVTPAGTQAHARAELKGQVARTHGDVLTLTPGEPTNTVVISQAIRAQERKALLATAQERSFDLVAPGVLIAMAGLLAMLIADRRRP